jgi:hypothetical protein
MSLDRSQQPPILPISNIPLPKVEKSALSNGLPVHIIHDESLEVVRIDFMFGCGSWLQDKPLISFLTSQMLKEGSAHYSSQQIAEKIDFYGASVQCSSSYHYSYITVYSLTKYVQQTLEVIADIIQNPTFPEEEFAVLLNKRRQLFLLDEEKVQVLASKNLLRVFMVVIIHMVKRLFCVILIKCLYMRFLLFTTSIIPCPIVRLSSPER